MVSSSASFQSFFRRACLAEMGLLLFGDQGQLSPQPMEMPGVCSRGTFGWKSRAAGFTGRPELVLWKLEIYQGVALLHPVAIASIDKGR